MRSGIVARKIEREHVAVYLALSKAAERGLCRLRLGRTNQRVHEVAISWLSLRKRLLFILVQLGYVFLKRIARRMDAAQLLEKPGPGEEPRTEYEDEDAVLQYHFQSVLVIHSRVCRRDDPSLLMNLEVERPAKAGSGHDVEGQGAQVVGGRADKWL